MNWFKKWIAKSALDAAAEKAKELVTVDNLSQLTADAVTRLLTDLGTGTLSDEKRERICAAVKNVSAICSALADALGDGKVTVDEVQEVTKLTFAAFANSTLTDWKTGAIVDRVVAKIKEAL